MTASSGSTGGKGSGPRYAPSDPTLPKPWRALVDGSTGYLYYWNPETKVTQYERPVAEQPPPTDPKLISPTSRPRDEGDDPLPKADYVSIYFFCFLSFSFFLPVLLDALFCLD